MSDPFTPPPQLSSASRPASRRDVLWNELEALHAQLHMAPPTATLTLEDLEAEVERLRQLLAQPPRE